MAHTSTMLRRACHRVGTAAAVAWWIFAVASTGFFAGITGAGLALYLVGVVVCYLLGYYLVRVAVWILHALVP